MVAGGWGSSTGWLQFHEDEARSSTKNKGTEIKFSDAMKENGMKITVAKSEWIKWNWNFIGCGDKTNLSQRNIVKSNCLAWQLVSEAIIMEQIADYEIFFRVIKLL